MNESLQLDDAFANKAKHLAVFAYIGRAINLCVDRDIIDSEYRTRVTITQQGMRLLGALNVEESELRAAFEKMTTAGYISEFLEYEQIFNGVVSRGESIH